MKPQDASGESESFGDSVAALYERYMVPMVFEPFAEELVARVTRRPTGKVLETAAGTGVVTRTLVGARQNAPVSIVATDLSEPMIALGRRLCPPGRAIEWLQADATRLPFPGESFDLVLCQFGAMFFGDRVQAYREARRVLRPGGRFVFSVWNRLEENDFAHTVHVAV